MSTHNSVKASTDVANGNESVCLSGGTGISHDAAANAIESISETQSKALNISATSKSSKARSNLMLIAFISMTPSQASLEWQSLCVLRYPTGLDSSRGFQLSPAISGAL